MPLGGRKVAGMLALCALPAMEAVRAEAQGSAGVRPREATVTSQAATHDSPRDGAFPAALTLVTIPSHGERIHAVLYRAAGAGRHPLVVMLHGFPGTEQNGDLAHAARRAGWHVVVPHYRGAWGSPGRYSWAHVLEDVRAVLRWAREDSVASPYGIASDTVVLVGHSLGGFAALLTASLDQAVAGAVSLAGFNFGGYTASLSDQAAGIERTSQAWEESAAVLSGTSGRALAEEAFAAGPRWDLRGVVGRLATRPVLLIAAQFDDVAPPALHHEPLVDAFRAAGARSVTTRSFAADHSFADTRIGLAQALTRWLAAIGH